MGYAHRRYCTVEDHDIPTGDADEDFGCVTSLAVGQATAWLRWRPGGAVELGVDPAGAMTPADASGLGACLIQLAELAGVPIPVIPSLA